MSLVTFATLTIGIALTVLIFCLDSFTHRRKPLIKKDFPNPGLVMHDLAMESKRLGPEEIDNILAILLYLSHYFYIIVAVYVGVIADQPLISLMASLFVSTLLRALQELGHFAVHGSLCPNKELGLFLTNLFFQYPCFKPCADLRLISHVKIHHPHSNIIGKDPNLDDLRISGLVPGIPPWKFIFGLIFPLTPTGIVKWIVDSARIYSDSIARVNEFIMRSFLIMTLLLFTFPFGMHKYTFSYYFVPVFILYPFWAWLSQLSEHQWYHD
jgi:fatty acid desaturase